MFEVSFCQKRSNNVLIKEKKIIQCQLTSYFPTFMEDPKATQALKQVGNVDCRYTVMSRLGKKRKEN